jgi:hypothetical protein
MRQRACDNYRQLTSLGSVSCLKKGRRICIVYVPPSQADNLNNCEFYILSSFGRGFLEFSYRGFIKSVSKGGGDFLPTLYYRAHTWLYDISGISLRHTFFQNKKPKIVLSQVFSLRTFSASDLGVLLYYVKNVSESDEYCVVSLIFLSPGQ